LTERTCWPHTLQGGREGGKTPFSLINLSQDDWARAKLRPSQTKAFSSSSLTTRSGLLRTRSSARQRDSKLSMAFWAAWMAEKVLSRESRKLTLAVEVGIEQDTSANTPHEPNSSSSLSLRSVASSIRLKLPVRSHRK